MTPAATPGRRDGPARPGRLLRWARRWTEPPGRRAERVWRDRAAAAATCPLSELDAQRAEARRLRAELDRFLHRAAARLAGSDRPAPPHPHAADWVWRPDVWAAPDAVAGAAGVASGHVVAPSLRLFHDCPLAEVTIRQCPAAPDAGGDAGRGAARGLALDVLGFEGSYLSLALDLPAEAVRGLAGRHLIRLTLAREAEAPVGLRARLNLRHGPNVAQILCEVPTGGAEAMVEFDLAHAGLGERGVEAVWLDLLLEGVAMNRVTIGDLVLCRLPRAEF
ncbi:DUF6478 family protein [Roseivivax sp. CAU 1761]